MKLWQSLRMSTFGDVSTSMLLEDDDIFPANANKLRAILCDNAKTRKEN